MFSKRILVFALPLLVSASGAYASLSAKYADWPKGPEQWLMTREDQKAWKSVDTDEKAQAFIDLFWARRDPTPGTPENQFRDEFERRVKAADTSMKTARHRGSLTDMGRVFVLLGEPRENAGNAGNTLRANNVFDGGQVGNGSSAGEGKTPQSGAMAMSQTGARSQFTYLNPTSLGLDMRPIVFSEDLYSHEMKIDAQQSNVYGAMATQVKRAIVSPELTAVPEWAHPKPKTQIVIAAVPVPVRKAPDAANLITGAAGAHSLVFTRDVMSISAHAGRDPLASLQSADSFAKEDDLGYALEYCPTPGAVAANTPQVKLGVEIKGGKVTMKAPPDEVNAEEISDMPGCYLVRGAIPLSDFKTGAYHMTVTLVDSGATKSFNLQQDFKVQ